eukprot:CAMPEP_0177666562 /NCGR_PEP_ID=MMETSP0447-20121125/21651_1 /TAXON_ID=0 /ORGANISM="Stygamoeba regulata, Strain BSH-02190019" /LENGTH=470 /DNA_ID=CAMNT_0019172725 /DNA_START=214 /DNA_END=1626 /DNA_ORIENTATION=-
MEDEAQAEGRMQVHWELRDKAGGLVVEISKPKGDKSHKDTNLPAGTYLLHLQCHTVMEVITPNRRVTTSVMVTSKDGTVLTKEKLVVKPVDPKVRPEASVKFQFVVLPEQAPAAFSMTSSAAMLLSLKFSARLLRCEAIAPEFASAALGKELSRETVAQLLARDSPEMRSATQAGFLRPFRLLLQLHPMARLGLAKMLGLSLSDCEVDPHKEAARILGIDPWSTLKSVRNRSRESWEKVAQIEATWHDSMKAAFEYNPKKHAHPNNALLNTGLSSANVNADVADALHVERDYIAAYAHSFLARNRDSCKHTAAKARELQAAPQMQPVKERLAAAGMEEAVFEFLVVFLVMELSNASQDDSEDADKNIKEALKEIDGEVLLAYLSHLATDPHDARTASMKKREKVKKVGILGAKVGIKLLVSAILPVVGVVILAVNVTDAVLCSSQDMVFASVTFLMLQKVMLTALGILQQ